MITIENLDFLREEVLVTELKQALKEGKENNIFTRNALPQDNSKYKLCEVVKVGKKQLNVKKGDKVLISGQLLQKQAIEIENQEALENIYRIPNSDQIFAILC